MSKFKKYEIGEEISVQLNLSTYLPSDHLCKELEKIVSELDIRFIEATYSEEGQNAYHPQMLLSVIFYGYATGIRSGRKLAKACKEDLAFLFLSKGYSPSKSVLNDFRRIHFRHFTNLFTQVLQKCMEAGLADPSLSIVDGSKLQANSSKRASKTKEQYEKWQEYLLADIASLEKEQSSAQGQEDLEVEKKLQAKKDVVEKVEKAIEQLSPLDEKARLNLTDTDSVIMKGKKGDFDTNYNVQAACGEDQIITYSDVVVDGNDRAQLIPALKGIAQNTGKPIKQALADADYGTYDSLEYMDQNNIEGYVPYRNMNATYEDTYASGNFIYNKEKDTYQCPQKQDLIFYRTSTDNQSKLNYKNYRTDACLTCPFQKKCCKKKGTARRVIKREVRQGLKDKMKEKLNSVEGKAIYKKRLHPIEAFFGQLKYNLGYQRFLLRGLEKVKAEFTLMCLTHNLRKLVIYFAIFPVIWTVLWHFLTLNLKKFSFPDLSMNFFRIH